MTNDELYKSIMVMPNVKSAVTYMQDSNITKADLSKLCKRYNIIIEIKVTREKMIDIFVNSTLGVKLTKKAANKYNTR
jgi:hypothetical protein